MAYARLFNNTDFSDAELHVYEVDSIIDYDEQLASKKLKRLPDRKYYVHTLVLATHCAFFDSVIRRWSGTTTTTDPREIRVEVPDFIPLDSFEVFLKSFYTEDIDASIYHPTNANVLLDVMQLCEMFSANMTQRIAAKRFKLMDNTTALDLDFDHAVRFFDLSDSTKDEQLKRAVMNQLLLRFNGEHAFNENTDSLDQFLNCRVDALKNIILSTTHNGQFAWVTENTVLLLVAMWIKRNSDTLTSQDLQDLSSLIRLPCLSDTYRKNVLPLMKWFRFDVPCIRPLSTGTSNRLALVRRIVIKRENTRNVILKRLDGLKEPNNTIRLHCGPSKELYYHGHFWGKFQFEFTTYGHISIQLSCATKMTFPTDEHLNEDFHVLPQTCSIHASIYHNNEKVPTRHVCLYDQKVSSSIHLFSFNEPIRDILMTMTELKVIVINVV